MVKKKELSDFEKDMIKTYLGTTAGSIVITLLAAGIPLAALAILHPDLFQELKDKVTGASDMDEFFDILESGIFAPFGGGVLAGVGRFFT